MNSELTMEELDFAISALKKNNSPGHHLVTNELHISLGNIGKTMLLQLFNLIIYYYFNIKLDYNLCIYEMNISYLFLKFNFPNKLNYRWDHP